MLALATNWAVCTAQPASLTPTPADSLRYSTEAADTATTIAARPTPLPTLLPTTPLPPTNVYIPCSGNCGEFARGGGTCRATGRCITCNDDRILQSGRCYASIACKGRRIQSGSQTGNNCRCVDDNCHYCNRAPDGDTCKCSPSNVTFAPECPPALLTCAPACGAFLRSW